MEAFQLAVRNNDFEKVKSLIESGVDIHYKTESALRYASEKGYLEIVKLLIEKGADITIDQNSPLRWASHNGHLEVAKFLLAHGANVQSMNNCSMQWACEHNHLEVAKFLLANGAHIHDDNSYAIRWSCHQGSFDTVKLLIENGADIHVDNDFCLKWASKNGHLKVVKLLLEKGSYPTISDEIREQAHPTIKPILLNYYNLYFGIVSDKKLDIKLPNLQEINKDSKYYYVYKYIQDDIGYILENEDSLKKMLSSLTIGIRSKDLNLAFNDVYGTVRTFVNL